MNPNTSRYGLHICVLGLILVAAVTFTLLGLWL